MFGLPERQVQYYKNKYKAGTRIVLDEMYDTRPVDAGTAGTVAFVDDIGTIHVDWDNGRRLGVVPGEDIFHAIGGETE